MALAGGGAFQQRQALGLYQSEFSRDTSDDAFKQRLAAFGVPSVWATRVPTSRLRAHCSERVNTSLPQHDRGPQRCCRRATQCNALQTHTTPELITMLLSTTRAHARARARARRFFSVNPYSNTDQQSTRGLSIGHSLSTKQLEVRISDGDHNNNLRTFGGVDSQGQYGAGSVFKYLNTVRVNQKNTVELTCVFVAGKSRICSVKASARTAQQLSHYTRRIATPLADNHRCVPHARPPLFSFSLSLSLSLSLTRAGACGGGGGFAHSTDSTPTRCLPRLAQHVSLGACRRRFPVAPCMRVAVWQACARGLAATLPEDEPGCTCAVLMWLWL